MTAPTPISEPASSIIKQTAILLPGTKGGENYYAFNPWFNGECYYLCFYCDETLYRDQFSKNIHSDDCCKFSGKQDNDVMKSTEWKVICVFGKNSTKHKHYDVVRTAFFTRIESLLDL